MSSREYTALVVKESYIHVTVTAISREEARELALFQAGEEPAGAWKEDQDSLHVEGEAIQVINRRSK